MERTITNQDICLKHLACVINNDLFEGFKTKNVKESHIDEKKKFYRYSAVIQNEKSQKNYKFFFGYHNAEQYFFIAKKQNGEIIKEQGFSSFFDLKTDLIKNIKALREAIEKI